MTHKLSMSQTPRLCDAMWSYSEQHGSKFVKGVVETLCYEDGDSGRDLHKRFQQGDTMICILNHPAVQKASQPLMTIQ